MSDVEEPVKSVRELYKYDPSLAAAVIFSVIFLASFTFHSYQIYKYKSWYFSAMAIGAAMEGIGYIARTMDPNSLPPYIMQSCLLLLAPALMAASIYVVLGRIIVFVEGERYSLVRVNWLTKFFVGGNILSFLLQGTGGGILAGQNASTADLGENIVIVGLFAQIAFFGFFVIVAIIFHLRIHNRPTAAAELKSRGGSRLNWKKLLLVLYAASGLILVRSIFRVVEYIGGRDGYLLRNEIWLYLFDAVLMSLVVVVFNVCHPSRVLPGKKVPETYCHYFRDQRLR